jgi:tripartite-type tricarboxylate transporter receptor subunit TctC
LIKIGIVDPATMVRSLTLPPGTPKDKVKILRDAFMTTMKEPEFLAEANTAKLDLNPLSGHEVEKIVQGFFNLQPSLTAKLRDVVVSKN